MAILTWLGVPGEPEKWESLGFTVENRTFSVGRVVHACASAPGWGFDELHGDTSALTIETRVEPRVADAGVHPNLIDRVDHVVYAVPELDPAIDDLTSVLGEGPRRRAFPRGPSGPEMAFFRAGEGFIEVVASGRPASLMGIAFSTPDLDACVAAMRETGAPVGDPKPAVQGGRIASVWKEHVGWGVAIMEPSPGARTRAN
jgi:catechol 2,3-dioxygenase-like lactoylglutathione lyase family enzyme